ncbi:MAG: hypothetical protein E5V17_01025 [Mesorhizobium sp.]|uniref:hypothetical protein n=1 Tax=Mesorhizobium TaxID=68287 RepID=UPI000FCA40FD|nr:MULTISPECIES: hypothetical protein [Mesorhizobium]MDX8436036.1 hypothetical protein [Mesorhizobium abyssinicae]RUW73419.1 hypothetical protein EOA31_13295 [Mesorhizobium sp. M4B.F.Ca.ET.049.02.1.2]RWA63748.1 MAG: hypothetical protein EOQ27_11605 [Mesorhizobium sp.]TGV27774.1 hypothetical protein EN786_06435 [Mesorhizobium sp. M4B.F.Ca.ET.143.01.1.1]TIX97656.1 MAG: hypothetical protein E5V17_01025 [Mesorhizobium sp.]
MTEHEPTQSVRLSSPVQCMLWEHPEHLQRNLSELFERVETYEDSSHFMRALFRCRECGQRYLYEFYEEIGWGGGGDKMYSTLLPVQTQEEIDALNQTDESSILRYFPRLQWDDGPPWWNGKPK